MSRMLMRFFTGMHAKLVKWTGALGGGTDDGSVMVLQHKGAKSGKVRETPVMFVHHDGGYAIVASMAGAPSNPAWYHNLKANPDATVTVAREQVPVRARELEGKERSKVWAKFQATGERWDQYQERTDRVIPVLALDPL